MYDNVGGKLKGFAVVLCSLGIIGSIIGGIVFSSASENIMAFLATAVVGSLVAWLSAMALYGFGELVESSSQARDYAKYTAEVLKEIAKKQNINVTFESEEQSKLGKQEAYNKKVKEYVFTDQRLVHFFDMGEECRNSRELWELWKELGLTEKPYSQYVEDYLNSMNPNQSVNTTVKNIMLNWIRQTAVEEEIKNSKSQKQRTATTPSEQVWDEQPVNRPYRRRSSKSGGQNG